MSMDRVRGRGLKSMGTRGVLKMLGFIHPYINDTQIKTQGLWPYSNKHKSNKITKPVYSDQNKRTRMKE